MRFSAAAVELGIAGGQRGNEDLLSRCLQRCAWKCMNAVWRGGLAHGPAGDAGRGLGRGHLVAWDQRVLTGSRSAWGVRDARDRSRSRMERSAVGVSRDAGSRYHATSRSLWREVRARRKEPADRIRQFGVPTNTRRDRGGARGVLGSAPVSPRCRKVRLPPDLRPRGLGLGSGPGSGESTGRA